MNDNTLLNEELESKEAEPVANENVDDLENSEGSEEVATPKESDDLEFDDSSNEENKNNKSKSGKKQTAEEKRLAFQRRQAQKEKKRLEEERKRLEQEYFEKGLIKGASGVNKFTGKKIVDKFDVEEYKTMLEMEEKGLDPTDVFAYVDYVKDKQRAELKKQEELKSEEEKQQERLKNDIESFTNKYPNVDLEALLKDEDFQDFSENLLGQAPLVNIYETFLKISSKTETLVDKKARSKIAKGLASPGSLGGTSESLPKSIHEMTDAEFERYVEDAKAGKLSKLYN